MVVFDSGDDVIVFVGPESPMPNTKLGQAKAEELFEGAISLRPHCAALLTVDANHPIFAAHLRLFSSAPSMSSSPVPRPAANLSFSADDVALYELEGKKKSGAQLVKEFQEEAQKKEETKAAMDKKEKELEKKEAKKEEKTHIGNKLNDVFNMLDDAEVEKTSISYSDEDEGKTRRFLPSNVLTISCFSVIDAEVYLEVDDMPPMPDDEEAEANAVSVALEETASAWNKRDDSVDIEEALMRVSGAKSRDEEEEEEDE